MHVENVHEHVIKGLFDIEPMHYVPSVSVVLSVSKKSQWVQRFCLPGPQVAGKIHHSQPPPGWVHCGLSSGSGDSADISGHYMFVSRSLWFHQNEDYEEGDVKGA